ncbi:MAG: trehalose 6-phosphate phosphatase [Frankiaceae bacterium]|nr:trehalose 6-phosphate phosphatase [Frankiaceae bacterium]
MSLSSGGPGPPEPRTAAGSAGLAALLADPARAVVALDYDGTLSPIVDRPEDAVPAPGAVEALARLARVVGCVVLITGRPVAQVVSLAGLDSAPGLRSLQVLGQYGLQRWDARSGRVESPEPLPAVQTARDRLPDLLAEAPDGVSVEDKHTALVVHFRRAADPAAAAAALQPALTQLAEQVGLEPHPGRHVLELRPPGFDKGGTLRQLLSEREARSVLFAGDDVGDLPAFAAVEQARAGGVPGVLVCSSSPEVTGLAERADLVVDGPVGVVDLLDRLAAVLGDG